MFRVVPPPIISSANNCIYNIWYLSHRYCYLPLQLNVQFCVPNDGQRNRMQHVEQFIEINKSRNPCILLVVLQRKLFLFRGKLKLRKRLICFTFFSTFFITALSNRLHNELRKIYSTTNTVLGLEGGVINRYVTVYR